MHACLQYSYMHACLQYLRKRLTAEEMRGEQRKVVEGMMAVSRARGRLQDTGNTVKAFDGEEVDWYCCNVGAFHVKQAMDPSAAVTEDESIQRWLLQEPDRVLVKGVAAAVGKQGLAALVTHYLQKEGWLEAAKLQCAAGSISGRNDAVSYNEKALVG